MDEVAGNAAKRRQPQLKKISLWRIVKSLSNLLAARKLSTLILRPHRPAQAFKLRMKAEGRWQEYLDRIEEFKHTGDPWRSWLARLTAMGWRGPTVEVLLDLERQLNEMDRQGRDESTLDLAQYYVEYKRVADKLYADTAADCPKKDYEKFTMLDGMIWLYENWAAVMQEVPGEDNKPPKLVPNPHVLRLAKHRSLFTLADWAARNPEGFQERCFTMLAGSEMKLRVMQKMKPAKLPESAADEKPESNDEADDIQAHLDKWNQDDPA